MARELHFGRAAGRLGISQPPLSRAIARLERRLGVVLFERTSRRVLLTPAGEVLLGEASAILDALDGAVARTRGAYGSGPLRIATNPGTGSGLLRALVTAHTAGPDGGPVERVFTRDQAGAVRGGTADVALLCTSDDLTGLERLDLSTERAVALLPAGHPLAGRRAMTVAELREEPMFRPEAPVAAVDELVDLVAVGQLVVVVGESAADRTGGAVVAVPVADLPDTLLLLARRPGTPAPAVAAFLRAARWIGAGTDRRTGDTTAGRRSRM